MVGWRSSEEARPSEQGKRQNDEEGWIGSPANFHGFGTFRWVGKRINWGRVAADCRESLRRGWSGLARVLAGPDADREVVE